MILRSQAGESELSDLNLVVFGQSKHDEEAECGFPIHYLGSFSDDLSLRILYAAADVFVLPSRLDNLPNTGLEAHACGTPVVAFGCTGMVDIVDDRVTGYLAEPFDPSSLAVGIRWVFEDSDRRKGLLLLLGYVPSSYGIQLKLLVLMLKSTKLHYKGSW